MSDPNYIRKQATRMQSAQHPKAKEDAAWRILSNVDEPNLSDNGTLTQKQMQKAESIAREALKDA